MENQPQVSLKEKFLTGKIDFIQFRQQWLKLDQFGDHTENAVANILMLEDPEIKAKIESLGEEYKKAYFKMLSISYFHKAQSSMNVDDFRKAYEYAQRNSSDESYMTWLKYVRGTLAFFERDAKTLQEMCDSIDAGNNKEILLRLLYSLNKGDRPEDVYLRVYSNL